MAGRKPWVYIVLFCLFALSSCGQQVDKQAMQGGLLANNLHLAQKPEPAAGPLHTAQQPGQAIATPAGHTGVSASKPTPVATPDTPMVQSNTSTVPASSIPSTGSGVSPYGSPPLNSEEEILLTQKLFTLINSDRATRGLYAYTWNNTLSGGARLHSWNMFHCGFSHTCPNGQAQCDRIAAEGFAGYSDCGENIAYAGPFPTAWEGVYKIQESMVNEPPTGWHRIHLFSTTLHRIGIGVYVDPQGYIWFTEDMVS